MDERISFVRRIVPATETQFSVDWTPASLGSALILWFRADVGVTLSSSNVTSWADQSGHGYNVTLTSTATMPTYDATGFNGKPTIVFDNTNLNHLTTQQDVIVSMGTASSFFYVGTENIGSEVQGGGNLGYLEPSSSGLPAQDITDQFNSNSVAALNVKFSNNFFAATPVACQHGNNFYGEPTTQAISSGVNYRVGSIFDNSNASMYVNNLLVAQSTLSFTLSSPGTFRIGGQLASNSGLIISSTNSAAYRNGVISEVIVTNTALSAADRNNLDNYFKAHWNL